MSGIRFGLIACAAVLAFGAPAFAAGSGSASGLSAKAGPRADPAEAFRDGVAALEAGDYKTADRKFGDVLDSAPDHPEANYYKGVARIALGKEKSAAVYLERAIAARANFVEARERLALVKIELGEPLAAREQLAALAALKAECDASGCDEATTTRIGEAIDRVNRALAGADAGAEPDADEDEPSPDKSQALFFAPREQGIDDYLAAVRLINEARYADAIESLYTSQAIIGPHPDILNYLGFAHRKLGKMDRAKDYYAQALSIDPDHRGANEYLGELYLEIGEIDKARAQLARLDALCSFGCAEREDLARLIDIRTADRRASQ